MWSVHVRGFLYNCHLRQFQERILLFYSTLCLSMAKKICHMLSKNILLYLNWPVYNDAAVVCKTQKYVKMLTVPWDICFKSMLWGYFNWSSKLWQAFVSLILDSTKFYFSLLFFSHLNSCFFCWVVVSFVTVCMKTEQNKCERNWTQF